MRVQLEKLVGRVVYDVDGRKAGRLEEVIANRDGFVNEYILGKEGLWERLGITGLWIIFLGREKNGKHVPWEKMDLINLKLKCRVEEL